MRITVDIDNWRLENEEKLLVWLRNEAVFEDFVGMVDFVIISDSEIQELNQRFFNIETPTDVIAFSLQDVEDEWPDLEPDQLEQMEPAEKDFSFPTGEVYVSLDSAKKQADEYSVSLASELSRLLLHGFLHLAGWDDKSKAEKTRMSHREDEGLNRATNLHKKETDSAEIKDDVLAMPWDIIKRD